MTVPEIPNLSLRTSSCGAHWVRGTLDGGAPTWVCGVCDDCRGVGEEQEDEEDATPLPRQGTNTRHFFLRLANVIGVGERESLSISRGFSGNGFDYPVQPFPSSARLNPIAQYVTPARSFKAPEHIDTK